MSKIGIHAQRPTPAAKQLVQAGARVAVLVSDFGAAEEYRAASPGITIIGRPRQDYEVRDQLVALLGKPDAIQRARDLAARFVESQWYYVYRQNPYILNWIGHNEQSFGGPNDADALNLMALYGEYEAERARQMADYGLSAVVGGFSTGYPEITYPDHTPDLRMWNMFLPALYAVDNYGGLLHLHEYAAPLLKWWTFLAPWGQLAGWLLLRYRQLYHYVIDPRNLDVPLVISECGWDRAGGGGGVPTGCWRDLAAYWAAQGRPDTEAYMAEQVIEMDMQWGKDPMLLGVALFDYGADNPLWERYRLDNAAIFNAALLAYMQGGQPMVNSFTLNQVVYVTSASGTKLLGADGKQQAPPNDTAGPHDSGKITATAQHLPLHADTDWFWEINFGSGKVGFVNDVNLGPSDVITGGASGGWLQETGKVSSPKVKPPTHDTCWVFNTPDITEPMWEIAGSADWYEVINRQWNPSRKRWFYGIPDHDLSGNVPAKQGKEQKRGWVDCRDVEAVNGLPDCKTAPPPDSGGGTGGDGGGGTGGTTTIDPGIVIPVGNLVKNPDFSAGWDEPSGNQTPRFWQRIQTPNGQPNIWPQKMQQGVLKPSIAVRQCEAVHKPWNLLPDGERWGLPLALILFLVAAVAGGLVAVYKMFCGDSSSETLQQILTGLTPGRAVHIWAYILGETSDKPTSPTNKLEGDHFRMGLHVPGAEDNRTYEQAYTHKDVTGNDRHWNKLSVNTTVPADGVLPVAVAVQQNWAGSVDFFLACVVAEYADNPPPPDGGGADISAELAAADADLVALDAAQAAEEAAEQDLRAELAKIKQKQGGNA